MPHQRLSDRVNITFRPEEEASSQKLTRTEEQTLFRYILDLGSRGFVSHLCRVSDMADELLAVRGGEPVSKHWAERLVTRSGCAYKGAPGWEVQAAHLGRPREPRQPEFQGLLP